MLNYVHTRESIRGESHSGDGSLEVTRSFDASRPQHCVLPRAIPMTVCLNAAFKQFADIVVSVTKVDISRSKSRQIHSQCVAMILSNGF